jgi:hypothetical protein
MNPHDGIKVFSRTIAPEPILGLVFHRPEASAVPMRCFENVWDKIARDRGTVRYGWTFLYRLAADIPGAGYLMAIHHAVWQPPASTGLIDVTPFHADQKHWPVTQDGSVLFLFDEAAQPVITDKLIAPLPTRYFPLDNDDRLISHVEELKSREEQECRDIYGGVP